MSLAEEMRKISNENQRPKKEPNYDAAYKSLLSVINAEAKNGNYKTKLPVGFPVVRDKVSADFLIKMNEAVEALIERLNNDKFIVVFKDDLDKQERFVNFWLEVSW